MGNPAEVLQGHQQLPWLEMRENKPRCRGWTRLAHQPGLCRLVDRRGSYDGAGRSCGWLRAALELVNCGRFEACGRLTMLGGEKGLLGLQLTRS